jgi:hypothetical protein
VSLFAALRAAALAQGALPGGWQLGMHEPTRGGGGGGRRDATLPPPIANLHLQAMPAACPRRAWQWRGTL